MNSLRILRAAIEVKRRYSEAGALDMAVGDFQRQRKPGSDFLDWSCWFLRPIDDMTREQQACLYASAGEEELKLWCEWNGYYYPLPWEWTERRMIVAEVSLRMLEKMVAPSLWEQGERIKGLL